MDADQFLVWSDGPEDDTKFELVDGVVVAMAPERVIHAETKGLVYERLRSAVRVGKLRCQVLIDGVGVRVGTRNTYIPDVLVRCGEPLGADEQEANDPVIVVEVLSPSTGRVDLGKKLIGYFALPSLFHYLIVSPGERTVLHHQRRPDGVIETRMIVDGAAVTLNPPGIVLDNLFPPAEPLPA